MVWSCYSDPFRIAAWYESGGRAAAPVPLPDPFDKNVLKSAKQTSSFAVPPSLDERDAEREPDGIVERERLPPGGGGINLTWICGFSIPLITICAFFVLNIFLSLLNIVFFWMAFIKICIPFPIPAAERCADRGLMAASNLQRSDFLAVLAGSAKRAVELRPRWSRACAIRSASS